MKKKRQALISELITTKTITTQEELLAELLATGIDVTQATVSRDIKEMRIIKQASGNGVYKYYLPSSAAVDTENRYMSIFTGAVISTDIAMNTVVLKCHAGAAQAAAAALDTMNLDGIAGTLAGDDTIFVLCYSVENAVSVKTKIDNKLGF